MREYEARFHSVLSANRVRLVIELGFDVSIVATVEIYGVNAPSPISADVDERHQSKSAKEFIVETITSRALLVRPRKKTTDGFYLTEVLYNMDGKEVSLGPQMVLSKLSR
jgi:hypothetical protein